MNKTNEALNMLQKQAIFFGTSTNFVQGAGGNLSVKVEDSLWIKASGTRFSDAEEKNIFVQLELENTRRLVAETEDLQSAINVASRESGLRPSIETAAHSLLSSKYVTHLHSIGAISRAIDSEKRSYIEELSDLGTCFCVDYAKPGLPLARAIISELVAHETSQDETLIFLLGNHGVIVGGPDSDAVTRALVEIENRWNPSPAEINQRDESESGDWQQLAPPGALTPSQAGLLVGGALTPDQVVFLGTVPFSLGTARGDLASKVRITEEGGVLGHSSLSEDAWEIAASFINVARATLPTCKPVYLTNEQIDELLNWDAEKWRKAQER